MVETKRIDPLTVPYQTLYTGAKLPAIGLGTFGSDNYSALQIADAVKEAIIIGYRHIDCASVYGNEKEIGIAFSDLLNNGDVKREELWITSKLWNNMHNEGDVLKSCMQTLNELKLDYLDMYLVHWPFPNFHAAGVSVDSRDPHALPYIHENFMKTWRQMEMLVEMGLVKHIGTSNVTIPKLKLILRDAKIKPACNEMELHPHFQQPELMNFITDNGIVPIGFCPIGSPNRPERDKTPEDTSPISDPIIIEIAKNHHVHPAVICIKWAVQNGQIPIPFSVNRDKYFNNLECVTIDPLSKSEMEAISMIDKNCRFIKGQVFLWSHAESWKDLWDLNGYITK